MLPRYIIFIGIFITMLNLVKAQAWVLELQQMSNAQLRRLYGQGELMSHSEKLYHT